MILRPDEVQCVDTFNRLAREDPDRLAAFCVSDEAEGPHTLTFAAEALRLVRRDLAVPTILRLLTHTSALVREGALYGILDADRDLVIEVVRDLSLNDPSLSIRGITSSRLDDWS